jgi:hypothetical protein
VTKKTVFALLCCLTLGARTALADGAVSQADEEACTPDVFRLCQDFIPNEAPIVACLEAKRSQLSPACAQVMYPPPPPGKTAPKSSRTHRSKSRHRHHS